MDLLVNLAERAVLRHGLTTADTIDRWYDHHADEVGPRAGARAVARIWTGTGRPDTADAAGARLGRCGCGRVWRTHRDTPGVRNVVLPAGTGCSGWPVLGVPPSWYRPRSEYLLDVAGHTGPGVRTAIWSDSARVHHLVVPGAPARCTDGPADLEGRVSRAALRGLDPAPSPAPPDARWARGMPGYDLDERLLDRPWQLRAVALVLAVGTDRPDLRPLLAAAVAAAPSAEVYAAWPAAAAAAVRTVRGCGPTGSG